MCAAHLIFFFVLAGCYCARKALDPEGGCLTLMVNTVNGINCNRNSIRVFASCV